MNYNESIIFQTSLLHNLVLNLIFVLLIDVWLKPKQILDQTFKKVHMLIQYVYINKYTTI